MYVICPCLPRCLVLLRNCFTLFFTNSCLLVFIDFCANVDELMNLSQSRSFLHSLDGLFVESDWKVHFRGNIVFIETVKHPTLPPFPIECWMTFAIMTFHLWFFPPIYSPIFESIFLPFSERNAEWTLLLPWQRTLLISMKIGENARLIRFCIT